MTEQPPKPPRCPISRQAVTACIDPGYRRHCAAFRMRLVMQTGWTFPACPVGGKAVGGVKIIQNKSTKTEEAKMATAKKSVGPCGSCGGEKVLSTHLDKKVCSMCLTMRVVARNNPSAVIAALEEFGTMPKPAAAIDTGSALDEAQAKTTELYEENAALKKELAGLKEDIAQDYSDSVMLEEVQTLTKKIEELQQKLNEATDREFAIREENHLLHQKQREATTTAPEKLRDLTWKLADGVMSGAISGVTVDDIRTLREAA